MIDYKVVSLANQVFEAIEKNILNGVYAPGEIISESKLSKELGVSRTPIREALSRLEEERLVAPSPTGTVVLGITEKDVEDIFLVKRCLEPQAYRMAAENISDEELAKLKKNLEQQQFYAEKQDTESMRNLDTEFHDIIYQATGSRVLYSILSPNHHKLLKLRKASLEHGHGRRISFSIKEHELIYEALSRRDAEEAARIMSEHVSHTYDNIKGKKA